jgi:hypothetical protein
VTDRSSVPIETDNSSVAIQTKPSIRIKTSKLLDTSRTFDVAAVEAICEIPDDAYRLQWVSYAYYKLAEELSENFGKNNASWPSFARWSAFTIAEALRLDEVNPRLEEVLRQHVLPPRVAHALVEIQRRLRSLDDGAMPAVLALGNRLVFHEVGHTVAHFLQWIKTQEGRDPAAWSVYERKKIQPFPATDFFRPSYATWLRGGMHAYYDAWWVDEPTLKAQKILKGNLLIGAYEQWRVDAFFEVALDFNPGALIDELRLPEHGRDQMVEQLLRVKHAGTRRALRHQWAMINWAADAYAAFLTRYVLTWDAPLFDAEPTAVRLGCEVPARLGPSRATGRPYRVRELGEAKQLFNAFDRSSGELRNVGARNFRRFTDRMSFIANLFREQQRNPHLHAKPKHRDLRLLDLQLNDEYLDKILRKTGDETADKLTAGWPKPKDGAQPQLRSTEARRLMRGAAVSLPDWADPIKIEAGQQFFKDNALSIASALFCAALPKAYTAARGARVLLATAELVSDVERRIAETARLLLDIMMPDPDGLDPESRGYRSALSVRGYHAAIRHLLRDQEPWKVEWRGETPINQEDLLGTLTTFTVVIIEALEQMGVDVSPKQKSDYLHTWLVAGHLLGIDYKLLRRHELNPLLQPLNYTEMVLVRDVLFRRHAKPSASGQMLTRALIGMEERALPVALRPLPPAAIRRFIGDDAADMLEVPPAGPARVLMDALGPIASATGLLPRGGLVRPRLHDMTTALFREWTADGDHGSPRFAIAAEDVSVLKLRPTVDVDLVAAEQDEEAMKLYVDVDEVTAAHAVTTA